MTPLHYILFLGEKHQTCLSPDTYLSNYPVLSFGRFIAAVSPFCSTIEQMSCIQQQYQIYLDDQLSLSRRSIEYIPSSFEKDKLPISPSKKKVCRNYSQPAGCRFGENCNFKHINSSDSQRKQIHFIKGVCTSFLTTGYCKYRQGCWWQHHSITALNKHSLSPAERNFLSKIKEGL